MEKFRPAQNSEQQSQVPEVAEPLYGGFLSFYEQNQPQTTESDRGGEALSENNVSFEGPEVIVDTEESEAIPASKKVVTGDDVRNRAATGKKRKGIEAVERLDNNARQARRWSTQANGPGIWVHP